MKPDVMKAVHKFHREIVATGHTHNFDSLAGFYCLNLARAYRVRKITGYSEKQKADFVS